MAYRSFRHFLETLETEGELRRVQYPVSPYLEITEIADRVMKAGGPALLFEQVVGPPHRLGTPNPRSAEMGQPSIHHPLSVGSEQMIAYQWPVAINTMGTRRRMSLALGCQDFEEHAERIRRLIATRPPQGPIDALRQLPALFRELKSLPPKEVSSGECQQVVLKEGDVDLTKFPALTCWPEDGGPYITLPLVFTFDPATGKRNVGMYRIQLFDRKTCGMHWQMHKTGMRHMEEAGRRGEPIQVAVALGGDPAHTFSAIAPLPPGIDEMLFSGFLRKEPVRMTRCAAIDAQVPADADVIIEGYVDPTERRLEGPFGDHTGYYSLADPFPVLHVTCVTHRREPIWPATIVGVPPMEDAWMGKAVERIFLPLIQLTLPELVDIHLPVAACFHNIAFVSISKKYPGHAYKVMNAIWGLGGLAFSKFVFVFDDDCDVQDLDQVLFRIGANCDPMRDMLLIRGPVDQLDHAAMAEGFGGKVGFDCTHKWSGENGFSRRYPKLIRMADDVKAKVDAIWNQLGIG